MASGTAKIGWGVAILLVAPALGGCGEDELNAIPVEPEVPVAPTALCAVDPASLHPPFESATWLGNRSFDPDGKGIVSYVWRLQSQPNGSAAVMPSCRNTPDCGPFTPDLAGVYVAQLTVKNVSGLSSGCTASLEAVPLESLWVEMYWTHDGDDMDLHLMKPGATPESDGDCYYGNCVGGGLDWGVPGESADDPALDLDDIPGVGPENINITAPAAGEYTVLVHDYPGSAYSDGNDVTVKVYIGGNLLFTDVRTIAGEDTLTYFCRISWPSGTITRL